MLSSIRLCTITLATLAGFAAPGLASDAPFTDISLQDAAARAQKENRLLVLFFDNDDSCRRFLSRSCIRIVFSYLYVLCYVLQAFSYVKDQKVIVAI